MDTRVSKQSIRSRYLSKRDDLSFGERKEKSRQIWEILQKEEQFLLAECVLVYMDYRSEVMTTGLVEELLKQQNRKRIYAPRVEGLDISFYEITSLEELEAGYQGIREPVICEEKLFTEKEVQAMKCLVLVPGTVFDKEGYRMGYGKGFYDRFIHKFPGITRIGLAFNCQIAGQIPIEAHDQRMDYVITEAGVIKDN